MFAWIYTLIVLLVPHAEWSGSYEETARAIADVAEAHPLYPGEDGRVRTAVELVAIASFESSFDPRATREDRGGLSVGLMQVNVSNLRALGLRSMEQLFDVRTNLEAAVRLLKASHATCRGRPLDDQLAQYATGGPTCSVPGGLLASRHRMKRARELLAQHPPFWSEPASPATWKIPLDRYQSYF